MWVQSTYFRGHRPAGRQPGPTTPSSPDELSDEMIVTLAERLQRASIRYAFVFSGPFGADGSLPDYAFSDTARASIRLLREHHPGVRVLPWIGGVEGRQVHLGDPRWVEAAVASAARLATTMPIDGLHIDLEYMFAVSPPSAREPYAVGLPRFLASLRHALPDVFLSTVLPATVDGPRQWKLRHDSDAVAAILASVDQLAVLFYDTGLESRDAFARALDDQVAVMEQWRGEFPEVELLVAAGTFENRGRLREFRDPTIEGLDHHFASLRKATERRPGVVSGSAVYCDWETDADEWHRLYRNLGDD